MEHQDIIELIGDLLLVINSLIQFVALVYVTKVCFVGKCKWVKNVLLVVACVLLLPSLDFFINIDIISGNLPVLPSDTIIAMIYGIYGNEIGFSCYLTIIQLPFLALLCISYALLFGKNKKVLAIFTYLMFYMVGMFGIAACLQIKEIAMGIAASVIVLVIQFMFCRRIIPQIIRLSKEEGEVSRSVFYLLPSSYIIVASFLISMVGSQGISKTTETTLFVVLMFLEFLIIITFDAILSNLGKIHEISHKNEELKQAKSNIKTLSVEVMEALAHTIDAKDEYTKGHSIRVAKYSRMIAEKMGLDEEKCESIYYMGLLHDLGKIGVPNEIINSTTKLTDEEYAVIKTHPGLGYDILSEIKSRPELVIGARWHHERYDGKGYPDGKSGEDIPLMARIISVADSYDAMTSNRSYRKYLPQDMVRTEIERNSGSQFDPNIAGYMIKIIDEDKEYKLHE